MSVSSAAEVISMTAQTPIPLRADPAALRQAERRSFMRAAAAAFIGHRDREAEVDGYDMS